MVENNFNGDAPIYIIQFNIQVNFSPPQKEKKKIDFAKLVEFIKPLWWILKEFSWTIPAVFDFLNIFQS
jgi:hypothetical protein